MNKAELRKQYLAERKKLSEEAVTRLSQHISYRFSNWLTEYAQRALVRSVHCFLPIRKQKEIDTHFIINYLRYHHPTIQIVLSKSHPENCSMTHFIWDDSSQLVENALGIPEPRTGALVHADQIDVVLVPLLIFDEIGHRVGYGKGYYDRFMADCRPQTVKIGLSFFSPIPAISDVTTHDVQLHYCITPERVWRFPSPTPV